MTKKNKNENHSHISLLSLKSPEKKWGINLGKIRSPHPLNCKCGSRNLEYQKKKGDLWAECSDCASKFQVAPILASHLQHLVGEVKP